MHEHRGCLLCSNWETSRNLRRINVSFCKFWFFGHTGRHIEPARLSIHLCWIYERIQNQRFARSGCAKLDTKKKTKLTERKRNLAHGVTARTIIFVLAVIFGPILQLKIFSVPSKGRCFETRSQPFSYYNHNNMVLRNHSRRAPCVISIQSKIQKSTGERNTCTLSLLLSRGWEKIVL